MFVTLLIQKGNLGKQTLFSPAITHIWVRISLTCKLLCIYFPLAYVFGRISLHCTWKSTSFQWDWEFSFVKYQLRFLSLKDFWSLLLIECLIFGLKIHRCKAIKYEENLKKMQRKMDIDRQNSFRRRFLAQTINIHCVCLSSH